MLEIEGIKKQYILKDQKVDALKGVSVCFRRQEFVSILGPSGCGKTTLLNIIGGLDRYTDGDIIIDGVSTKKYKDKDWDNYRNHRVGFIFQSYNLIPHQTVLENVELALTLSGIKKKERRERAIEVLNKVGLGDKLKSKPNQLSGGQMQRVAIARALVNDPEIILADEPTGALDTKTSVQIMDLIKEVSQDKLVIMVTHNPELAENYSNRIIKLLDGELTEDSNPYTKKESEAEIKKFNKKIEKEEKSKTFHKTEKKKSMSFVMALFLSFRNILTKKARTILVAFAGSIGIIGIALILSISSGFSTYINKMQEDTLSTYPITIEAKSVDFTSIITSIIMGQGEGNKSNHEKDGVYPKESISSIAEMVGSSLNTNNLTKFYAYLNENYDEIKDSVTAIKYNYDINLEFYDQENINVQPNSNALMTIIIKYSVFYFQNKTHLGANELSNGSYEIYKIDGVEPDYSFINSYDNLKFIITAIENSENHKITLQSTQVAVLAFTLLGVDMTTMSSMGNGGMMSMFRSNGIFYEMINNEQLIKEQYDLVGETSKFPEEDNDALLVLDKNNEVDEYVLYALGILEDEDMDYLLKNIIQGNKVNIKIDYNKVVGKTYKVLQESDYYVDDADDGVIDFRIYNQMKINNINNEKYNPTKYVTYYNNALLNTINSVKIVGVVRQKDNVKNGSLSTGVVYSYKFTQHMVNDFNSSLAVQSDTLKELSLTTPSAIQIYVNSFDAKENIKSFIEKYNKDAENGDEISYSDLVGIIMSTVSTIITSITYVLIAFVSVSLIVSSIMIGIITYISVIERTKEIGVLRSVGASKRDIKRVFTAESFIIGLTSGVFGILTTIILNIPINLILQLFTQTPNLAVLPVLSGFILIFISVALTFIAGLVPAHIASKKDPVLALRTE